MDEKVMARVNEHAEYVDKHIPLNYKRLFTVLVGSQNYGLSDENSDVDTYSFVIPELEPAIFDSRYANVFSLDKEHATVRDFRIFGDIHIIGCYNFLEVLFSDYVNVAPRGENLYNYLRNLREDFAHCNMKHTALSMCGAFNGLKRFVLEDRDNSSKKMAQAFRTYCTLTRYCKGYSFKESLNLLEHRTTYFLLKKSTDADARVKFYNSLDERVDELYSFWIAQESFTNKAFEAEVRDKLTRLYYNYINLTFS